MEKSRDGDLYAHTHTWPNIKVQMLKGPEKCKNFHVSFFHARLKGHVCQDSPTMNQYGRISSTWQLAAEELFDYFRDFCQGYGWGFPRVFKLDKIPSQSQLFSSPDEHKLSPALLSLPPMVCQNFLEANHKSFSIASLNSTNNLLASRLLLQETPGPTKSE